MTPHIYMGPDDRYKLMECKQKEQSVTSGPRRVSTQHAFPMLSFAFMSPRLKLEASQGGRSLDLCVVAWKRATQENCQKRNIHIGLWMREK